nr:MAG TPA: hypothetical protein [Bacteriophage sp.]
MPYLYQATARRLNAFLVALVRTLKQNTVASRVFIYC